MSYENLKLAAFVEITVNSTRFPSISQRKTAFQKEKKKKDGSFART